MPQTGIKEYNSFVKGLVTEANALTYPENASKDEDNFDLNRDGSRQRRLGIDYESLYTLVDTGLDATAIENATINSFRWDNVDNNPDISIGIVQILNKLWFVDLFSSSLSSNLLNGGSALTISGVGNDIINFSQVNGKAIGANKNIDLFSLSYDEDTDAITQATINIKVRDIWGIDDGLAVNERQAVLSNEHKYNLHNQGWSDFYIGLVKTGSGTYPSNAQIVTLGKNAEGTFSELFLRKQFFGNTPAPKGKYIIDAFSRSTSRNEFVSGTALTDIDNGRPSTLVSYNQRLFYSGVSSDLMGGDDESPKYSGAIFFTKVIANDNDLSICYQEADPTSEHIFDVIDSDGGYISIPEASNILRLETTDKSVVVIAENGIWEIYGDTGGFVATSYQISKVTDVGAINSSAIVNAEGTIMYWAEGGIYTLTIEPTTDRLISQNVTENTIQTFYNNIPSVGKLNAVGTFDVASRKVSWLYNDEDDYDGVLYKNKYNKELILDTVLQAFYPRSRSELATESPYVAGFMDTPSFLVQDYSQDVLVNGAMAQVNAVDVIVTESFRSRGSSAIKCLTIKPSIAGNYKFTFSQYVNTDFLDWYSDDNTGIDFTSFLETGYELFGSALYKKQSPYVLFHFNRTETGFELANGILQAIGGSSCLVQARWDFADHTNSGKYGTQFQAYRLPRNYIPTGTSDTFDYGQEVITTKSKLRGRGRSLSLYITSEVGKDMHLLGWGMPVTAGTNV